MTTANRHTEREWVSDVTLFDGPASVRVVISADPMALPTAGEVLDQAVSATLAALVGQTFRLETVHAAFEEWLEEQYEVLEAIRDREVEG